MSSQASKDKSSDAAQALNIERKKTKVLKEALKQERKERATLESEFDKTKEQIVALNNQLQDKVRKPSHNFPVQTFSIDIIFRGNRKNGTSTSIRKR